jgi:hypothetical protein
MRVYTALSTRTKTLIHQYPTAQIHAQKFVEENSKKDKYFEKNEVAFAVEFSAVIMFTLRQVSIFLLRTI